MLCAIRTGDGQGVLAPDVEKGADTYHCPECNSAVLLKKCRLKTDHFAHKPPTTCTYGTGESEPHRRSKWEIFQALHSRGEVTKLQLERRLDTIRPDVSFMFHQFYVSFEVQISSLSIDAIIQRTSEYAKKKIALLWLAQWTDRLLEKFYTPSAWEKWVHAANFGRVYFWKNDLTVVPCHFGECYLWKPGSEWRSREGELKSVGYYWQNSKRYVTPVIGPQMNLLDDFQPVHRDVWEQGRFPIPKHTLWLDKHIKTWPKIPKPNKQPRDSSKSAMAVNGEIIQTTNNNESSGEDTEK